MDDRHVCVEHENLDLEDWRADLEEEYPAIRMMNSMRSCAKTNSSYLSDERVNLNIQLFSPFLLLPISDLWNGRRMGYKEIESGKNPRLPLFQLRITPHGM